MLAQRSLVLAIFDRSDFFLVDCIVLLEEVSPATKNTTNDNGVGGRWAIFI